jgi:hypothetical protein
MFTAGESALDPSSCGASSLCRSRLTAVQYACTCCLPVCFAQRVKDSSPDPSAVLVLPFDLLGSSSLLLKAQTHIRLLFHDRLPACMPACLFVSRRG